MANKESNVLVRVRRKPTRNEGDAAVFRDVHGKIYIADKDDQVTSDEIGIGELVHAWVVKDLGTTAFIKTHIDGVLIDQHFKNINNLKVSDIYAIASGGFNDVVKLNKHLYRNDIGLKRFLDSKSRMSTPVEDLIKMEPAPVGEYVRALNMATVNTYLYTTYVLGMQSW